MGKGEIARYEHFLLFPQSFQKVCFPGASKGVIVWEWIKEDVMANQCGYIKEEVRSTNMDILKKRTWPTNTDISKKMLRSINTDIY